MDNETLNLIATSAVVSALVGGLVTFLSQHRLLARKAQLDYELEAKKRLYEAVGPLRLQLLLAARDLVRRVGSHHLSDYDMSPDGYYASSFVYRILAPLAVGQLIEKQMSTVDFTVDVHAIELLKFITAAERVLTGPDVVLEHPEIDWSGQSQHLFRDNLRAAASTLVKDSTKGIMRFSEFHSTYSLLETDGLADLSKIFDRCKKSLTENSIFWVRLTGYALICANLIQSDQAKSIGFSARELPVDDMICATNDDYYKSRLELYKSSLQATLDEGL